jgi:hypothetical protein
MSCLIAKVGRPNPLAFCSMVSKISSRISKCRSANLSSSRNNKSMNSIGNKNCIHACSLSRYAGKNSLLGLGTQVRKLSTIESGKDSNEDVTPKSPSSPLSSSLSSSSSTSTTLSSSSSTQSSSPTNSFSDVPGATLSSGEKYILVYTCKVSI